LFTISSSFVVCVLVSFGDVFFSDIFFCGMWSCLLLCLSFHCRFCAFQEAAQKCRQATLSPSTLKRFSTQAALQQPTASTLFLVVPASHPIDVSSKLCWALHETKSAVCAGRRRARWPAGKTSSKSRACGYRTHQSQKGGRSKHFSEKGQRLIGAAKGRLQ